MGKTIVTGVYTLPAAVAYADAILGQNRVWNAVNSTQAVWLERQYVPTVEEARLIEEIKRIASFNVAEVNQFFADQGVDITLDELPANAFAIGVVLKMLVEWRTEGMKIDLTARDGNVYTAACLEDSTTYDSPGHAYPVIAIPTKTEYRLFMTMTDTPPADEYDLIDTIQAIRSNLSYGQPVDRLVFPMVDVDIQTSLDWLVDLWTVSESGENARVIQALRQTKFKMNEKGALIVDAVGMSVLLESVREFIERIIDQQFLVWVERDGLTYPLFCGYIDYENWKDPGSLDG